MLEFRLEFLKDSADVCSPEKITKENSDIGDIGGFKKLFGQKFVGEADDCGILQRFLLEFTYILVFLGKEYIQILFKLARYLSF